MALFFDAPWFDAKLARRSLPRETLARALGLSEEELAEMWKDQREVTAQHVAVLADLLGVTPQDVADHAGISTPVPRAAPQPPEPVPELAEAEAPAENEARPGQPCSEERAEDVASPPVARPARSSAAGTQLARIEDSISELLTLVRELMQR
jgi:hypothetical protein